MLYCHDTYGLGHLRRAIALGTHLHWRWPTLCQLIVTGSPLPHQLAFPERTDYVKLPSVQRIGPEQDADPYAPRVLPISLRELRDLRADILLDIVRHFQPDALIVDVMPIGVKGELVPALFYLRRASPGTRLILGMRDVLDDPPAIRHAYSRDGVYELLDDVYDRILVYGQQDLFDVVSLYGFSPRAAAKTRFVGYMRPAAATRSPEVVRAELGLRSDRLVLVTVGGGRDGFPLLHTMLTATLRQQPRDARFDVLLVTGPLMPPAEREALRGLLPGGGAVRLLEFVGDMPSLIAAADVVVSMGGYNSVCEILSLARPAIVVPRAAKPTEQLLRAEALGRRGLIRMIHPDELTPDRLVDEVNCLLDHPPMISVPLALDGLEAVAAELEPVLAPRC